MLNIFGLIQKKDVPLPFVQCLYVESTDEPLQNIQGAIHHIFRYDYLFSAMLTSTKNALPLWQSFQPSPRIFVECCKYTNISVTVQIIGHFFCVHYYKRKIPTLKQDCKAWGRRLFCRQ